MDKTTGDRHNWIPPTGLTVVVNPMKPCFDVVFVHGFTGHPVRTWRHNNGDMSQQSHEENEILERPRKIQKLNHFSGSQQKSLYTTVYWPEDLIPSIIPDSRVMTYGYDTHIRHKLGPAGSQNTVYDIAWDFLIALEAERRVEPARPVLFIVHSLGGIVVKEMLRRSSDYYQSQSQTHLRHVFISTVGIIFFGTPHSGADPRGLLHRVAEKALKAAGFSINEQIVNSLLPSAERLKELRDEFGPRAHQQEWMIHSFQEQYGVALLGGQKVVEDTSSCLNLAAIEITEHIGRNHMEMCRFTGPNDVEFKKVASALRRMISSLSTQIKRKDILTLSNEQKRSLLESLRFDQIDARWMTIKKAHTKTCTWLLKKTEYLDWLDPGKIDEHHGFLWIRGKPGTGKSTLMKFLLANARKTMRDRIVICFFFNARGEGLEMSTLGTYQSLLLQLLERLPALQSVFDSLLLSIRDNSAKHQWTVETLKILLEQAVLSLGDSSLVCLIDALDECDEGQIRDMTSFFEHVGELAVSAGIRFQVCFSSRHYPTITIRKEIRLDLEGQEGHTQDIISYLESELRIGQSKMAEQVRIDVQEKASGIFLWVVLVVGILNKEYDSGRKHALRRRVHDIPGDLHELFRDILTRDFLHREELVLCVQWVLFARQPLRPEQIYHAIRAGVEPQDLSRWDSDEISISDITKYIIDSSKGLAEITTSKTPTVQFIHQSVKDFFLRENGLNRIWPELGNNFQGQSHDQLKRCCISYIQFYINTRDTNSLYKDLPKASTQECKALRESVICEFPFLEYAVHHVLYHADSAEGCNISQVDFIQSFPVRDWLWLDNLFEKHQIRRHTLKASLLYILAENNMSNLIRIHPSNLSFLEIEDERYGFPLLASLATGNESAVGAFIATLAVSQSPGSLLQELCSQYIQKGRIKGQIGRDFHFSKHCTALYCIAVNGDKLLLQIMSAAQNFESKIERSNEESQRLLCLAAAIDCGPLVKQLLEHRVNIDARDTKGRIPLSQAAANGHEATVKLLLENKAEIDTKDDEGGTPLSLAAANGHEAVVKVLLENKSEINSKNTGGRSPLCLAAARGHDAVVRLLLEKEAEVDSTDEIGGTPLLYASTHGHEIVVKLLLENKADINIKDKFKRTPLSRAVASGHAAAVELLLANKAEVNSRDSSGSTPLSQAASSEYEAAVKLLLETDKVDVDSKDNYGRTPLSLAASNGHELVVKLLLETGKVDVDSKDNYDQTPLSHAAYYGREVVVKLLLETNKVDVNSKNNNGETPLWIAARWGHLATVQMLLRTGKADVDSRNINRQTPLWIAASYGRLDMVKILLGTGKADVNSKDDRGRTPLWSAALCGHLDVIKMLLGTGKADVNSKDNNV